MSIEASVLAQHGGNISRTAKELGISRSTLRERLRKAGIRQAPNNPKEIQAPQILSFPRDSIRILAIGDVHDTPKQQDKSRFEWMGKHAAARRIDGVVQLGDIASFDSLNGHIENDSIGGKHKPSFLMDCLSLKCGLDNFNDGLGGHICEKHITLGNHEQRVFRFENATPEMEGVLRSDFEGVLNGAGWSSSPYGAFYFIEQVGFTHVPLNRMGKPYGGKTAARNIANDALHDVVYGNSHCSEKIVAAKLGSMSITVVNAGCALPNGHIEGYARHNLTGWWWGVVELVIARGKIASVSETSMAELAHLYKR